MGGKQLPYLFQPTRVFSQLMDLNLNNQLHHTARRTNKPVVPGVLQTVFQRVRYLEQRAWLSWDSRTLSSLSWNIADTAQLDQHDRDTVFQVHQYCQYANSIATGPHAQVRCCWADLVPLVPELPVHIPVVVPRLNTTLFPFQQQAVHWMLACENVALSTNLTSTDSANIDHSELPIQPIQARIDPTWSHLSHGVYCSEQGQISNLPDRYAKTGGILADEMGLGKTLMMISLILLHKSTDASLRPTLLITPKAILYQWIQELHKFSPHLRVLHYEKVMPNNSSFKDYDLVIVSIEVLRKELDYTYEDHGRSRRAPRKYDRVATPLTEGIWWRVVLDEAQMIDGYASKAAKMANLLPRRNSWCMTGTPAPKSGQLFDMFALLGFVGVSFNTVQCATVSHFKRQMAAFIHANTKDNVSDQLILPKQLDATIKVRFDSIEQLYYDDLMEQAQKQIRQLHNYYLELSRLPLPVNFNKLQEHNHKLRKSFELLSAKMKEWVLRLRQTCCHPQISSANQRMLGGTMKSISAVLDVMLQQSTTQVYAAERQLILAKIEKAHLQEANQAYAESRVIYTNELKFVVETISQIQNEIESDTSASETAVVLGGASDETPLGSMKARLQIWKELRHRLVFFVACNYHMSQQDKEQLNEHHDYAALETQNYELAADIRTEILCSFQDNVNDAVARANAVFARVKYIRCILDNPFYGGVATHLIFEDINTVNGYVEAQWNTLVSWRKTMIQIASSPLEDANADPSGEEFEQGVKIQEQGLILQDMYMILLVRHRLLLTGVAPAAPTSSASTADNTTRKELEKVLESLQPESNASLKTLFTKLQQVRSNSVSDKEIELAARALAHLQPQFKTHLKTLTDFDSELIQFRNVYNLRVVYYVQLNKISDGVTELPKHESERLASQQNISLMETRVIQARGRNRYLSHLKGQERQDVLERECLICRVDFTKGVVTHCGHMFCQCMLC